MESEAGTYKCTLHARLRYGSGKTHRSADNTGAATCAEEVITVIERLPVEPGGEDDDDEGGWEDDMV